MENIGVFELVKKIRRLNAGNFCCNYLFAGYIGSQEVILTNLDMSKVKLPKGYEYNEKNGVTNKHHTASGIYEEFHVVSVDRLR